MDQKGGDWFFEQGEHQEEDKSILRKYSAPKLEKVWLKNGKHLAQKWEPDSNLSFNLSCTMQFPILRFRFRWNNSTNYKKYPFDKVLLANLVKNVNFNNNKTPHDGKKIVFLLQQVDICVDEVFCNNHDNNVKLF